MTEMKSFRVKRRSDPPIPFKVELEKPDDQVETHEFHAVPVVHGTTVLDLVASGSIGNEWQAAALRKFWMEAVVPEDLERFTKLLDKSDPPIDIEQLMEIANWLVEQYGERPTPSA